MLPIILLAVVVLLVAFVIIVATRPSQFRVTRRGAIEAPPEVVFPQINNLHNWEAWSPWAKMDSTAKNSYDGPLEGVGSSFAWAGNKSGAGRMTITESKPHELVRFRLEFLKPFKATNVAEFTILPEGGQTVVTWSMSGTNNFMAKAVGLFMDCDKMCGGFFEKGLADMKAIAESQVAVK
ncbi:MAG TPA: SRPBCC family protein [Chthoniobacter sp.]|jgi:uncharacterized protein YndB with AHSA1/START domain